MIMLFSYDSLIVIVVGSCLKTWIQSLLPSGMQDVEQASLTKLFTNVHKSHSQISSPSVFGNLGSNLQL